MQRSSVLVASENGSKVEPKPVNTVFDHPVTKAVQDHILHYGMITVERISAATEIIIMSIGSKHVVNLVVKAFERKGWTKFISLGSMVKNHIQNNLHVLVMKFFDQTFQFHSLAVVLFRRAVAGIWCKKADRVISPEVKQQVFINKSCIPHFVKFKDRHQLNGIDPKFFQVRNLFFQTVESTGMFHS